MCCSALFMWCTSTRIPQTPQCVWVNSTESKLREKHNWMKLWTSNLMPCPILEQRWPWGSILLQVSQLRCDSRASSSQVLGGVTELLKARSPHPVEEGPPRISLFPRGWFSWPGRLRVRLSGDISSGDISSDWAGLRGNGLGSITANQLCLNWDTVLTSCK